MTIRELSKLVAAEFNKAVEEAECENFKEMKRLYDWDAADIKSEIGYMIRDWENRKESGIGQLDDGMLVNFRNSKDPDDECTYGAFKKMVFENVH